MEGKKYESFNCDDGTRYVKDLRSLYLKTEGFEVVLAKDGEEDFKYFIDEKIDLRLFWIGCCRKHSGINCLSGKKKNSSVKVLMLTATSESEDELAAASNSGGDELVKNHFIQEY